MTRSDPERILIVRPSALGDVCRTVPALASLRACWPHARIDWVVRDSYADAIRAHPDLDEAIPFPRARFARWWRPAVARDTWRWFRDLAQRRYDLVFDLQGLGRSGLITFATRAPRRVGYRHAREFASIGYSIRHAPPRSVHIVDQMLELLEREGVAPIRDLRLYVPSDAAASWSGQRRALLDGAAYAVLAPTSRWASKQWPIDSWRALLTPLKEHGFHHAVIIGAPGEEAQVQALFKHVPPDAAQPINLVGRTSIAETLAIIAEAGVVIANDSAPLHMAVGFDRPLVALFGPTDPAFVGPYGRSSFVVQHPDARRDSRSDFRNRAMDDGLMRVIAVEEVIAMLASACSAANGAPASTLSAKDTRA